VTFSLLGHCTRTGALGMIVSSSSVAVAARCAHVRADVGVVGSQNVTDPRLGPKGLDLLARGLTAEETLARVIGDAPHPAWRQVAVLSRDGDGAVAHGAKTLGLHAGQVGAHCVAAGNMLANTDVPSAMVERFEATEDDALGDRLIAALIAGEAAGGEAGQVHSAGLVMAHQVAWPVADLRVDWSETPIAELTALWMRWKPEMDAYVSRALDPDAAPSYGVPGDP
jgi:uncharacterized Ntn-hydrolase superfamily protein